MFGNIVSHNSELLKQRKELLGPANRFPPGNSKVLNSYKNLPQLNQLSTYCFEWCVGLVLGDASLQKSAAEVTLKGPRTRLKIQQTKKNMSLLLFTKLVLLPYVNEIFQSSSDNRSDMYELNTINHPVFNQLSLMFKQKKKLLL